MSRRRRCEDLAHRMLFAIFISRSNTPKDVCMIKKRIIPSFSGGKNTIAFAELVKDLLQRTRESECPVMMTWPKGRYIKTRHIMLGCTHLCETPYHRTVAEVGRKNFEMAHVLSK